MDQNNTFQLNLDNMSSCTNIEDYNIVTISNTDFITGTSAVTLNDYTYDYKFNFGKEWDDYFPDFSEVKKMCKKYPALEKAFENFKTVYELVKDDYNSTNKS